MTFQSEIASRPFEVAELEKLEALDAAACAAMEDWLFDPANGAKIEANKAALEERARALADNGTALLKIARKVLCGPSVGDR